MRERLIFQIYTEINKSYIIYSIYYNDTIIYCFNDEYIVYNYAYGIREYII